MALILQMNLKEFARNFGFIELHILQMSQGYRRITPKLINVLADEFQCHSSYIDRFLIADKDLLKKIFKKFTEVPIENEDKAILKYKEFTIGDKKKVLDYINLIDRGGK